ncbi:adapter protein CIKS isoform X1 [Gouania willdenowi]|uniref:SEFIR domain-containing protein n=1 Tax=Gouania willdenowi TaxID=441366 RepID=A0A8C5IAM3_GOUWI|nr:adapter protein CIKS isoform X1 [Gouania willdenowi]
MLPVCPEQVGAVSDIHCVTSSQVPFLGDIMDVHKGPCTHRSIPVEMDERMIPSSLDLGWCLPCQQYNAQTEPTQAEEAGSPQHPEHGAARSRPLGTQYQCEPRVPALITPLMDLGHRKPSKPSGVRVQAPLYQQEVSRGPDGPLQGPWGHSRGEEESLERPLTLMSDDSFARCVSSGHPEALMHVSTAGRSPTQESYWRERRHCPPANLQHHNPTYYDPRQDYPAGSHQDLHFQHQLQNMKDPRPVRSASNPEYAPPIRGLIHEVSVRRSLTGGQGANVMGVRTKTISLPEECRNVFITYSVDTANDMFPFTKFLIDQGFRPAIDLFDNAIRRLDVTKWMDSFLKDKSVLIIMAISPRYAEDVEGVGEEEHGLHTKYIHNQLQNEYIQQGCLNFRLIPVLFRNATKRHVPHWLRSTRIYSWPRDTEDLLLRLFREERYILPQQITDPTITVRPL